MYCSVATPSPATSLARAGFIRRFAACGYDALLVGAIYLVVGLLVATVFNVLFSLGLIANNNLSASDYAQGSQLFKLVLNGLAICAILAFYLFSWLKTGQTLGMRAWRLKVQTSDGRLISTSTAIKRLVYALFGFGNVLVLFDSKKLSLADRLTATEVVVLPAKAKRS